MTRGQKLKQEMTMLTDVWASVCWLCVFVAAVAELAFGDAFHFWMFVRGGLIGSSIIYFYRIAWAL